MHFKSYYFLKKPADIDGYLMCVCADGHPEGSRQAKVSELDLPLGVDEEVLGLQVSMKNPVRVAEGQALQQLEKITLQTQKKHIYVNSVHFFLISWRDQDRFGFVSLSEVYLHQRQWDTSDWGGVHELFKILMKELKNKVELVLGVDDIPQSETR